MLCTIFIILSIAYGGVLYWHLNKAFNVDLLYTTELDPNIKEEHKAFQRTDRKNWKFWQMFICGFFLLIPRIIASAFIMIWATTTLKLMGLVQKGNHNKEYSKLKRQIGIYIAKITTFVVYFSFSFHNVKRVRKNISDYDPKYKVPENITDFKHMAPISISNHVSWVDIMIILAGRFTPSFLSKAGVAKYPLYGDCTTSLQSIFLDRNSAENRNQASNMIKERIDFIKDKKNFQVLHVFPEGTTSSGKSLISFKKGAFEHLTPINIMCIKYGDGSFHPAIDIGQLYTVIFMLCSWNSTCTVYELGTYYPQGNLNFKGDDQDWEIYARKVKEIMMKVLNVPNSEAGYRDMCDYEVVVAQKNKEMLKKLKK